MFDWIETASQPIADFVNGALGPFAEFLEHYVWGWPSQAPLLAIILLGTGFYVTVRLMLIQIRGFRHAIDITRGVYDNPEDEGDLNHFQALTTALSATVGIGNIAGVAIAIRMGGPGAMFWMWVTAFFGMALKYTECTLAVQYRKVNADGSVSGGPMYYIEKGLGKNWKWMAMAFAAFTAVSSFGGGCMNQSNTLADQVRSQFGVPTVISGLFFTAIVATVIIGGIRRIGKVTAVIAPGMALLYVGGALLILVLNFGQIPGALATIVSQAFSPESLFGGGVGSLFMTMLWGIRRGLFSNEAGQGSAPIAHATAKTDEPVREGLVASLEPFIDTLVICTMTGLVIVMTGAYQDRTPQELDLATLEAVVTQAAPETDIHALEAMKSAGTLEVIDGRLVGGTLIHLGATIEDAVLSDPAGDTWHGTLNVAADGTVAAADGSSLEVAGEALLTGAPLTSRAFYHGLGGFGALIVTLSVVLFAVSTGISWSYYGDRAVEYLFGSGAIPIYRWLFIGFFFMGSILPLKAVWTYGDVALGMMSFPNLIAILFLSGGVARMTRDYMSRDHKRFK